MPYKIEKNGESYDVISEHTGRVMAHHAPPDAEEKAKRQVHLLEAIENDPNWKPTNGG
jgi:hypothetical protein